MDGHEIEDMADLFAGGHSVSFAQQGNAYSSESSTQLSLICATFAFENNELFNDSFDASQHLAGTVLNAQMQDAFLKKFASGLFKATIIDEDRQEILAVAKQTEPPYNVKETRNLVASIILKYQEADNDGLPFKKPQQLDSLLAGMAREQLEDRHCSALLKYAPLLEAPEKAGKPDAHKRAEDGYSKLTQVVDIYEKRLIKAQPDFKKVELAHRVFTNVYHVFVVFALKFWESIYFTNIEGALSWVVSNIKMLNKFVMDCPPNIKTQAQAENENKSLRLLGNFLKFTIEAHKSKPDKSKALEKALDEGRLGPLRSVALAPLLPAFLEWEGRASKETAVAAIAAVCQVLLYQVHFGVVGKVCEMFNRGHQYALSLRRHTVRKPAASPGSQARDPQDENAAPSASPLPGHAQSLLKPQHLDLGNRTPILPGMTGPINGQGHGAMTLQFVDLSASACGSNYKRAAVAGSTNRQAKQPKLDGTAGLAMIAGQAVLHPAQDDLKSEKQVQIKKELGSDEEDQEGGASDSPNEEEACIAACTDDEGLSRLVNQMRVDMKIELGFTGCDGAAMDADAVGEMLLQKNHATTTQNGENHNPIVGFPGVKPNEADSAVARVAVGSTFSSNYRLVPMRSTNDPDLVANGDAFRLLKVKDVEAWMEKHPQDKITMRHQHITYTTTWKEERNQPVLLQTTSNIFFTLGNCGKIDNPEKVRLWLLTQDKIERARRDLEQQRLKLNKNVENLRSSLHANSNEDKKDIRLSTKDEPGEDLATTSNPRSSPQGSPRGIPRSSKEASPIPKVGSTGEAETCSGSDENYPFGGDAEGLDETLVTPRPSPLITEPVVWRGHVYNPVASRIKYDIMGADAAKKKKEAQDQTGLKDNSKGVSLSPAYHPERHALEEEKHHLIPVASSYRNASGNFYYMPPELHELLSDGFDIELSIQEWMPYLIGLEFRDQVPCTLYARHNMLSKLLEVRIHENVVIGIPEKMGMLEAARNLAIFARTLQSWPRDVLSQHREADIHLFAIKWMCVTAATPLTSNLMLQREICSFLANDPRLQCNLSMPFKQLDDLRNTPSASPIDWAVLAWFRDVSQLKISELAQHFKNGGIAQQAGKKKTNGGAKGKNVQPA
ncbi:unnamed protein product [Amoebophrya sp. A25]|nr:unnamed protein product [Amoebophrya sp. A25]|eukprot:GSA25T00009246001.1